MNIIKNALFTFCYFFVLERCLSAPDSFSELKSKAELGDANAQYALALKFENGDGVERDDAQAVIWYFKAADGSNAAAQYQLFNRYQNGRGVEEDHGKAQSWCRKAAEQNLSEAQLMQGMDNYWIGGISNDLEAIKWFEKAAAQTNATAQSFIGSMFYDGRGVKQSYEQSAKWFFKAADSHYAMAKSASNLKLYIQGILQDSSVGVQFCQKEGDECYARGSFCLGQQYRFGLGADKNIIETFAQFSLAAKILETYAKDRDDVKGKLSAEQVKAATMRIEELQKVMAQKKKP